ncbi:hypothetical protein WMY93_034304, partial [Mugilogobius chulae]
TVDQTDPSAAPSPVQVPALLLRVRFKSQICSSESGLSPGLSRWSRDNPVLIQSQSQSWGVSLVAVVVVVVVVYTGVV